MDILQEDTDKGGRFLVKRDGQELAELSYVWAGADKLIIDHTEVDESLKGQGVGNGLVARAVEYAREKGAHILPLCPYAKHVMNKTPEYADVLMH